MLADIDKVSEDVTFTGYVLFFFLEIRQIKQAIDEILKLVLASFSKVIGKL